MAVYTFFVRQEAAAAIFSIHHRLGQPPSISRDDIHWPAKEWEQFDHHIRKSFESADREMKSMIDFIRVDRGAKSHCLMDLIYGSGALQRQTLRLLVHVGPAADFAIPELRRLLRDTDTDTRELARIALTRIASDSLLEGPQNTANVRRKNRTPSRPWYSHLRGRQRLR